MAKVRLLVAVLSPVESRHSPQIRCFTIVASCHLRTPGHGLVTSAVEANAYRTSAGRIDERAEELAPMVLIPNPESGVAEDLAQLARARETAITGAASFATALENLREPIGTEHIQESLLRRCHIGFDALAKRSLVVPN